MKSLRTVSTRRLLALIVAFVTVVAAGTAIALAAGGGGPVPPAKPLAQASEWLAHYQPFWESTLDHLDDYVRELKAERAAPAKSPRKRAGTR